MCIHTINLQCVYIHVNVLSPNKLTEVYLHHQLTNVCVLTVCRCTYTPNLQTAHLQFTVYLHPLVR